MKTQTALKGGSEDAAILEVTVRYDGGAVLTRQAVALTRESIRDLRDQCDHWLGDGQPLWAGDVPVEVSTVQASEGPDWEWPEGDKA